MLSLVFVLWLTGVVASDLAPRRVPNRWVLVGAVLAIVTLAVRPSPLAVTWQNALVGGVGAFAVLPCFYAVGMMGAGGVKFAGVLGLWLGEAPLLPIAVGAGLLAGCHAFFYLARQYGRAVSRQRSAADASRADTASVALSTGPSTTGSIPYAGYLAVMALPWIALGAARRRRSAVASRFLFTPCSA